MGESRNVTEARVVFGRSTVDEALADPSLTIREVLRSPDRLRDAVKTLQSLLPDRLQDATGYASTLPHPVRVAIAGLWCCDSSARRVLNGAGLELRDVDNA
jgi:hypothetical protein